MIKKMMLAGIVLGAAALNATIVQVRYNDLMNDALLDENNQASIVMNDDIVVKINDVKKQDDGSLNVSCVIEVKGVEHMGPVFNMNYGDPVTLSCENENSVDHLIMTIEQND